MKVPKPEEKRNKVDDIKEGPKNVNKVEPKKEKLIDRIIRLLRINEFWIHEKPI